MISYILTLQLSSAEFLKKWLKSAIYFLNITELASIFINRYYPFLQILKFESSPHAFYETSAKESELFFGELFFYDKQYKKKAKEIRLCLYSYHEGKVRFLIQNWAFSEKKMEIYYNIYFWYWKIHCKIYTGKSLK